MSGSRARSSSMPFARIMEGTFNSAVGNTIVMSEEVLSQLLLKMGHAANATA